jgi:predicted TIM-barrel fold metal-dependent hydrolase
MQRFRIEQAELTDPEKKQILHDNAERVFGSRLAPGG